MADEIKKEIKIDVVASAKQFKAELNNTAKDAVNFNKNIKGLQKAGLRDDKVLQKLSKDFAKLNANTGKAALQHEKALAKALKEKANILRSLHKQGKQNSAEFEKEQKALRETADLYSDIKKKRIQTTGLTKEEKIEKSGGLSKGLKTVVAGGVLGIAGLAVGAIKSRITDALEAATEYNKAAIESLGDQTFDKAARSRARGAGRVAGFTATETMQAAGQTVRQTGQAEDAGIAQQFSRSTMMDVSRAVEFMGQQARGGIKGQQAKKEQEKIIAAGFTAGMTRGRLGEFIQGVATLTEGAQGRTAGEVRGSGYADLLAAFGKSGRSGLQGSRGAAVLQQLEQGVMAPGAGEAGQSLVLRSKGFGVPGQTTDYYTALKRQQTGFAGERGADELKSFIDQLQIEFGKGSQAAALAGSETTGVSLDIMEKVIKVVNTFSGDSKDLKKQIAELTKDSLPIEEQVRDILEDDLAASLKQQVDLSDVLVRQGTELLPISLDIKKSINELVTIMLDKMIPIFLDIRDFIKDLLSFTRGTKESYVRLEEKIKSDITKVQGEASPESFKKFLETSIRGTVKELENMKEPDIDALESNKRRFQVFQDALRDFNLSEKLGKPVSQTLGSGFDLSESGTPNKTKSVSNMSSQEFEDAVARGTAKGVRNIPRPIANEAPVVNVPAPVVRTTVISPEPVQIQNR